MADKEKLDKEFPFGGLLRYQSAVPKREPLVNLAQDRSDLHEHAGTDPVLQV